MKHSIKKIFKNLNIYLLSILLLAVVAIVFIVEQHCSFTKIDILNYQKTVATTLTNMQQTDKRLLAIEFNNQSTLLSNQISKLHNLYRFNFVEKSLLNNEIQYLEDLETLSTLTAVFNKSARDYLLESDNNNTTNKKELNDSFKKITSHIDAMMLRNIFYDEIKFSILEEIAIFSFIFVLFMTFWYRTRLHSIYQDILFLYSVETDKKHYQIFSQEADAISLRMKKGELANTDLSSMTDQVTGINNYKGMLHAYSNKKGFKENYYRSVTVFEIDNFSKSYRPYSPELTQAILKKVAFTISLHEQTTDIIARIDYNQFAVILSRADKEQCFKDIELIKQSISEITLNLPDKESDTVTVSGGFIIKHKNTHLEEALKQAQELLKRAKENGKNKIFQTKDMIEREL